MHKQQVLEKKMEKAKNFLTIVFFLITKLNEK